MSDTDKLVQTIAAQALPDVFKPGLAQKYPGYISTIGYGSGYNNTMADLEQRQVRAARSYAFDSDAERASNTIVGMFMTAAKLSGKVLTEEEQASIRETARVHGRNIEVYLGMARAMGLSESAIDYIRRIFYGEKGSTVNLFDKTYSALRARAGHGAAINFAKNLSMYQFGKKFDRAFTGGLNADQFASTYAYMAQNGGFRGVDLSKGAGFSLIDDRGIQQAVNYMPAGASISEMMQAYENVNYNNSSLMAQNNRRALAMGTEAYKDRLKQLDHGQLARELGTHLDPYTQDAYRRIDDLDQDIAKMKKEYRVSLTKTRAGLKEAKEELHTQIAEQIEKAKSKNDEKAVKDLENYEKRLAEDLEDLYIGMGEYDENGKELNSFELVDKNKIDLHKVASEKIKIGNREYTKLQLAIGAITKKKHEIELSDDPNKAEKVKRLNKMLEYAETRKTAFANTSVLGEIVTGMHGNKEESDKVAAYGNVAEAIRAAMSASGKPIQLEEALQASKAIMPMGESAQAMRTVQDAIKQSLLDVTARHGSVEQYLLQMSSGKGIADQFGVTSVQSSLLANMGANFNKYGALYGLTDKDSNKGADDLTKKLAQNQHRGVIAAVMRNIMHQESAGDKSLQNAMSKMSESDQKRFTELQHKMETEGPASFTDLESRELETLMLRSGIVDSADLRADSVVAQRATEQEAETYQEAVMGAAKETEFNELGDKSEISKRFGLTIQQGRDLYKEFFVKNQKEIRDALWKGGAAGKEALLTTIDKADISDDYKEKLRESVKKSGDYDFRKVFDNTRLSDSKTAAQQEAMLATTENFEADKNDQKTRAKIASIFDQTDPNSLGRIVELITSKKFNASDMTMKDKMQMLTEAFGTTLSNSQKKAAAFSLLRDGRLVEGMAYKGLDGKQAYLNKSDIEVATYAMQHPEEFAKKLEKAGGPDGKININGHTYTAQAAQLMLRNGSAAAGAALGLEESEYGIERRTEGDYLNEFKDSDVKGEASWVTANLMANRLKLVKAGYISDPRYNQFIDMEKTGGENAWYHQIKDIAKKITSGELNADDYGVGAEGRKEIVAKRGEWKASKDLATKDVDLKLPSFDTTPITAKQDEAIDEIKATNTKLETMLEELKTI